jgi:2-polyprenyl-3-methyl-5-hydroxy-6-metoxy-1,4-benzoquinol methylase
MIAEKKDQLKSEIAGVRELFIQKKVPLFQNKVFLTEADGRKSPSGHVRLVQSLQTGFVFNQAFDESLMVYDVNYHNEQTNSAYYKKHQDTVFDLVKSFGIEGKKVVEIGCGKGHFFDVMQANNINCIGFDPAYEGNNPAIIKDYFSEKYNLEADLIILRHTLEHIMNPHLFLQEIAKANHYNGYVFIEVPAFDWIVDKKAFWDIFYEHCNYFTEETLAVMFQNAHTGKLFGDQYIYCHANLDSLREKIPQQQHVIKWDLNFTDTITWWEKFVTTNTDIVIWGAGAKGSTFLNLVDPDKTKIKAVIDINPEKQNKHVALSGHPIYGTDKLADLSCKHIIVMNENYLDEIKQQVREMNLNINIVNL